MIFIRLYPSLRMLTHDRSVMPHTLSTMYKSLYRLYLGSMTNGLDGPVLH